MDIQRIILWGALFFTLMMIWQAWQKDYAPQPQTTELTATADGGAAPLSGEAAKPAVPVEGGAAVASADDMPSGAAMDTTLASAARVHVVTDLFDVEIDEIGGDLRHLALRDYPVEADKPEEPFILLDDSKEKLFVAQAALRGAGETKAPDHHQRFHADKSEYRLAEGEDSLAVRLNWRDESGIEVAKIYTFSRGSYLIDVTFEVKNGGTVPWKGYMYRQLQQRKVEQKTGFINTYTGGVIYSEEEKYEKIEFDDMAEQNLHRTITGGWAAMIQHYFLASWVPESKESNTYYTMAPGGERYIIGMIGSSAVAAPGESVQMHAGLFAGPKLQDRLEKVAEGLDLTVDYGILTIFAKPMYVYIEWLYSILGNWGWAIILLTLTVKLLFYPLSATSYKSMARMRKMQPRMAALKEQYGDDRQKMSEAMMKLYREEKINPLGGCLPIVVQIPVFIALYWVLLESVEMRQAPFILWITDLSSRDPYFVLPIIMGATMLLQHRLNPAPVDPMQAKMMQMLPIVFTIFFAFFPAGLVLYWVVNNMLSVAQQWYITRVVLVEKK